VDGGRCVGELGTPITARPEPIRSRPSRARRITTTNTSSGLGERDTERAFAARMGVEVTVHFRDARAGARQASLEAAYLAARQVSCLNRFANNSNGGRMRIRGADSRRDLCFRRRGEEGSRLMVERGVGASHCPCRNQVAYHPGRVAWDSEKIRGFRGDASRLKEFCKWGTPWVAVRFADGQPAATASEKPTR